MYPLVNYSARRQSAKSAIPPNIGPENVLGAKNRIVSRGTGRDMPIFRGSSLKKKRLSEKRDFDLLTGCKSWPIDTNGVNPVWIWWSDVNPDFFPVLSYKKVVTITATNMSSSYLPFKSQSIGQPTGSVQVLRLHKKMLHTVTCLNGQKQIAHSRWECFDWLS